mmetsp:Transcript_88716/g.185496  ORF Transcript_88716/g.185496 Transcript_88716/m.185496 type:complete len:263 (+) Transcript_88716:415-1203(+)
MEVLNSVALCSSLFLTSAELSLVAAAMYLSCVALEGSDLFGRFLVVPLLLILMRIGMTLGLMWGLRPLRPGQPMLPANKLLFRVASMAVISALLALWYVFWFVLLVFYSARDGEKLLVAAFQTEASLMVLQNCWLWWRFSLVVRVLPESTESVKVKSLPDEYIVRCLKTCGAVLGNYCEMSKAADPSDSECLDIEAAIQECGQHEENETCAVCLQDFSQEDLVVRLPCGHTFHQSCSIRWLRQQWKCPFRCEWVPSVQSSDD